MSLNSLMVQKNKDGYAVLIIMKKSFICVDLFKQGFEKVF
jgi:hypothetical protein